jgi:lipid-A-disaccharide synthase
MSDTPLFPQPIRIGIVAGEPSGDILAAGLLQQIKKQHPDAIIEGIGGPLMQAQGCQSLFDMEELSVMGLIEVLSRIRRLLYVRKTVLQHFCDNPPDVFIGVDAPDFNLKLERLLKQRNIKTVHYVSPTVWAWREKRIFGIAESTNLVLSIFPFEKTLYDKYDIPCEFVGHTMADEIPMEPDRQEARTNLSLSPDSKVLALLPGSRGSEVNTLLAIFMQSAELLDETTDNLVVLIPAVNLLRKQQIERYLQKHPNDLDVRVLLGCSREAMIASNAILLASGTATLEAMLCKRPMVAAYQLKWLTHQMMKWLYLAKYFTLPNLLADQRIIPELLQEEASPKNIASLLSALISGEKTQDMHKFAEIHIQLKQHANARAADAVLKLIHAK